MPSSVKATTFGAGQGNMCGSATIKKLAKSVVAKRDDVVRLRGWKCDGIFSLLGGQQLHWKSDYSVTDRS